MACYACHGGWRRLSPDDLLLSECVDGGKFLLCHSLYIYLQWNDVQRIQLFLACLACVVEDRETASKNGLDVAVYVRMYMCSRIIDTHELLQCAHAQYIVVLEDSVPCSFRFRCPGKVVSTQGYVR